MNEKQRAELNEQLIALDHEYGEMAKALTEHNDILRSANHVVREHLAGRPALFGTLQTKMAQVLSDGHKASNTARKVGMKHTTSEAPDEDRMAKLRTVIEKAQDDTPADEWHQRRAALEDRLKEATRRLFGFMGEPESFSFMTDDGQTITITRSEP